MKTTNKMMLAVCSLVSLAGAAFGAMETRAVINIPFEFVAGGMRMPAGEYRFTEDSNTGVIMVQGSKSGLATTLMSSPGGGIARTDGTATVSFDKVNGESHLTQFLIEGQPIRVVKARPAREASAGAMVAGH